IIVMIIIIIIYVPFHVKGLIYYYSDLFKNDDDDDDNFFFFFFFPPTAFALAGNKIRRIMNESILYIHTRYPASAIHIPIQYGIIDQVKGT
ncbi:hypothetical protein M432DRAFT_610659, partial [Thermoascus aurantiacus ATCC 26904]